MSIEELKDKYPNAYKSFYEYFEQEGWGANNADGLSEYGVDSWLPDFLDEYNFSSIYEAESYFLSIKEQL